MLLAVESGGGKIASRMINGLICELINGLSGAGSVQSVVTPCYTHMYARKVVELVVGRKDTESV